MHLQFTHSSALTPLVPNTRVIVALQQNQHPESQQTNTKPRRKGQPDQGSHLSLLTLLILVLAGAEWPGS